MKSLFELPVLTDEEIKEKQYPSSELWLLKIKGQVIGPFHSDLLVEFSLENQTIMESVLACSFKQDSWTPFFNQTRFQRRTPKLIKEQTLIQSDRFVLLIDGEKLGPFKVEEIEQKLTSGEILSSTEASLDDGHSWFKIYEHHHFDRRTHKSSEDIPFSPTESKVVDEKVKIVDSYEMPIVRGQDEFIQLAHLVRNNTNDEEPIIEPAQKKKKASTAKAEVLNFPEKISASDNHDWKRYAKGVALLLVFISAFISIIKINSNNDANRNYSFEYKNDASETNKRSPASINDKKPIENKIRKPLSRADRNIRITKPVTRAARKTRIRSRNKTNNQRTRVNNYHKNEALPDNDAYQELIDQEANKVLDVNRPEDKEFLNDIKREIANENDDMEIDRRDERREDSNAAYGDEDDSYQEEEEKPIIEQSDYAPEEDYPEDY